MGQEKKHLQGMAAAQGIPHAGVLIGSDVVMSAPPALRQKALRLVASKFALTTRMDAYQQEGGGEGGEGGRAFRAECEDKIMKWQEPSKGKEKKALPVPEMQARKKRAGKRVSKAKERFAMTEMRKEHGRRYAAFPLCLPSSLPPTLPLHTLKTPSYILSQPSLPSLSFPSLFPSPLISFRAFGGASAGAEYGDEAMGMDTGACFQVLFPPSLSSFLPSPHRTATFPRTPDVCYPLPPSPPALRPSLPPLGMLGSQGGRLRLPGAKEQKQNIGKKKKEEMAKMAGGGGSGGGRVVLDMGGGSGATGGMASSLVFTPTQGLELVNPNAMEEKKRRLEEANKSWFDSNSGFMSAKPK